MDLELNSKLYKGYIEILNRELIPATGCTEPISIAYAAAVARDTLGAIPDKVLIEVSGNIIKNVKSVVVPNTGGMRGIKSACAIGIIGGDASKKLEVIANITAEQIKATEKYLKHDTITVSHADTPHIFDIIITMYKDNHHSYVRIVDYHTNIVKIKRDDKISFEKEILSDDKSGDRNILTVENIVKFADILKIEDVKVILDQQIEYNMAIAEEGLKNQYGANIGKIILKTSTDVPTKAKAYAAAGSDARMNGCEMPVIINSGSGNQGITTSVPLIIFARENKLSKEKMYRALTLANLITLHLKSGMVDYQHIVAQSALVVV